MPDTTLPPEPQALLTEAARALDQGRDKEAERLAWRSLAPPRKTPRDKGDRAAALRALGHHLLTRRDFVTAATVLQRAGSLDRHHREGLVLLANAARRADRLAEAETAARQALSLDPNATDGAEALVAVLLEQGRPQDALRTAEAAGRPGDADAALLVARVARRIGAHDRALSALAPLLPHPAALLPTAHIHHDHGRFAEAEKLYRAARAAAPERPEITAALVNTLMAQGRTAEARTLHAEAGRTRPAYARHHLDILYDRALPPSPDPAAPLRADRAVLVNGPGVFSALPLGVALLKSHAEQVGGYRVTVRDTNAEWHHAVTTALAAGTTTPTFDAAADLGAALALYHQADFHRDPAFTDHSRTFNTFMGLLGPLRLTQDRRAHLQDGPLPWTVLDHAREILAERPAVVGLSVTYTDQIHYAVLLARALKNLDPRVVTVFGGGFFKDQALEGFLALPWADYLIVGDGEYAFTRLLDALNGRAALDSVPGLIRHAEGLMRNTVANPARPNDLPHPDFTDLLRPGTVEGYFLPAPVLPLISSRGCYWRRCTFCNHFASYADTYKVTAVPKVVDEMAHHVATTGVRFFTLVDEMISAKRFKKICEEILARGLDVRFYALAKPTADFTPEILDLMVRAGCRCVYWGLESGSEAVLARMDKGNDAETSGRVLHDAHAAGLRNHVFLMVGFPGETRADVRLTLERLYAVRAAVDLVIIGPFVLEEGTPLFNRPAEFGLAKVFPVRTLCRSALVPYTVAAGLTPEEASHYADTLREVFFNAFCPHGPHFGMPRDHILAAYADEDPAVVAAEDGHHKAVISPAEAEAALDAPPPPPERTLVPRWQA